jgi:predicted nucleic-acid-binding protein
MIGLDTNILARYYIQDVSDSEADKQHLAARKLLESGAPLFVCKTVIFEFECVMRGYYQFDVNEVVSVFKNLLCQPQIELEDKVSITQALVSLESGLDFADALHLASCKNCTEFASFDDKKFARRARSIGLLPEVSIPG